MEEAGNASKGMEMKNIPEEKVMRLSVQMNVKNEKNQMTQNVVAIAMKIMLVSKKNKFVRQKMILIWVLANWKGYPTEMPKDHVKKIGARILHSPQ